MNRLDSTDPAALKERVRILEAENALLNERSEDVFLLGLMVENLAPLREVDAVFNNLIERISILYEIPFCGFTATGRSTGFLFQYAPFTDRTPKATIRFSPRAIQELENGVMVCSPRTAATCGIELEIQGIVPTQIVLIPCSSRFEKQGVFLFAHDGQDPEFLPRKLMVLQQVIGLTIARIDNILLMEELKQVNTELESRVHDRTIDLQQAALALESEIAEREYAEQILEGERYRLRTVVENLPEGVIVLDKAQRVVLTNTAVVHARPLTGPVEVGRRMTNIADRPIEDFSSGACETTWLEVKSGDDSALIYEVAVRSLGAELGSVAVLRDVTEQRIVAENLLRQERVAAMGHLAAGVAHDFNNLIQAVSILAESLLLDASDDPFVRRSKTREILSLGERAAGLIRQILDYSRQTVARPQLIDLRRFVSETLAMLDRMIPETVKLELETDPGEHPARIDPVQLQQVLTNLTLNAAQAISGDGEIRVRLWACETPPQGESLDPPPEGWFCLSITDTGCGIPAEVQDRIYEPFFTTKERGQGTGLGLAQTYGIVKQNNGHITFASEPGQGSTFTIYLPAEPGISESEAVEVIADAPPKGNLEIVLVVEDDPTVRELTGEIVETLGYQPVCATNGVEALDLIECHNHDIRLVLSDVSMPDMGGVELAIELQQRQSALPVILMSGYAPEPMGGGFSSPNLAAWLQKPFSVNDLAQTLAEVLSDRS